MSRKHRTEYAHKLSVQDVLDISASNENAKVLAQKYNIHHVYVRALKAGKERKSIIRPINKYEPDPVIETWTDTELAYLAGFVDGEGTIAIYNLDEAHYRKEINIHYVLQIVNTNREAIDWVNKKFGGSIRAWKIEKPWHKQRFACMFGRRRAAYIIEKILPYLIIKKKQAEIFLECGKTIYFHGEVLKKDAIDKRMKLVAEMKELNKRGKEGDCLTSD